ncbi:MAG: hypothetical protein ABW026_10165 [Microvirga sp.]
MLAGLVAGLNRTISALEREKDLGTTVIRLRLAQMELRRMIHGLTDSEFDALFDTREWLTSAKHGDLAT